MDTWSPTLSPEAFRIDLNAIRDDNTAVAMVGFHHPQRVPVAGERVLAVDEDAGLYEAVVESVEPDHRVYLQIDWDTRRYLQPVQSLQYGLTYKSATSLTGA